MLVLTGIAPVGSVLGHVQQGIATVRVTPPTPTTKDLS